jgi:ribosome-binding protein aMBF1 (putative translation factor)
MRSDFNPVPLKITKKREEGEDKRVAREVEEEVKTVGRDAGQEITLARNGLGYTQKKLAALVMVPSSVIAQWESGTALLDKKICSKLEKILKIKIKK